MIANDMARWEIARRCPMNAQPDLQAGSDQAASRLVNSQQGGLRLADARGSARWKNMMALLQGVMCGLLYSIGKALKKAVIGHHHPIACQVQVPAVI